MNLSYSLDILLSATIEDEPVPLSRFSGDWAVCNLVLMIMTFLECIILLVLLFNATKERKKIDLIPPHQRVFFHNEYHREVGLTTLSIPIAILAIAEYFVTEDFHMQMVLYDSYTLFMLLFFIIQTIIVVVCRQKVLHIPE